MQNQPFLKKNLCQKVQILRYTARHTHNGCIPASYAGIPRLNGLSPFQAILARLSSLKKLVFIDKQAFCLGKSLKKEKDFNYFNEN